LTGEAGYGDSQSMTPNLSVVSDNQYENCGREEQIAMIMRTEKLGEIPPDWELWQKLYYKHPQAYLRQRLLAIKYLWEGKSRPEVTQLLNCNYKSLTKWIDKFLEGGLQKLTEPITHQVPSRLQPEQQLELKKMLLEQKPSDSGIDRYIWTGKIISQVIQSRWGVTLKESRIYEILEQLNLSHQKAHRDYTNADKSLQQQFVETLKKTPSQGAEGKNSFF
jgi:transposase